jgi:hypothetical protein
VLLWPVQHLVSRPVVSDLLSERYSPWRCHTTQGLSNKVTAFATEYGLSGPHRVQQQLTTANAAFLRRTRVEVWQLPLYKACRASSLVTVPQPALLVQPLTVMASHEATTPSALCSEVAVQALCNRVVTCARGKEETGCLLMTS